MGKHIQTMVDHWLIKLLMCSVFILNAQLAHGAKFVNLTFLEWAVPKGAVCLDGSPPAYALDEGIGDGANSWVLFIEGGGWCSSKADCFNRSKIPIGSTLLKSRPFFSGIMDNNQTFNPDFYNWNRVFVMYCDGGSFMADIEKVDPETNVTYRGARIFDAIMDDLLAKGMKNADNALLTGGSAGGLATTLNCDKFRGLLPNAGRVKCVADSGTFLHGENLPGVKYREDYFAHVVKTHELAQRLPTTCTSKMDPALCLFPENFIRDIQTPLFVLEAGFEKFQIENNMIPMIGGTQQWNSCITNLTLCNSTQLHYMKEFRDVFVETLLNVIDKSSCRGLFVHSCYRHGHIGSRDGWACSTNVADKTIAKAIGDWYFDRSYFQEIDHQYNLPQNCTIPADELTKKCMESLKGKLNYSLHP
ncbi:hypothetical protein ACP275_01G088200 [Erythranthe tilingii]